MLAFPLASFQIHQPGFEGLKELAGLFEDKLRKRSFTGGRLSR